MIKGLYTSISGMYAAEVRQQVLSSNIGNVATTGFKQDDVTTESFEQIAAAIASRRQPGTGAEIAGKRIDLSQGPVQETGAPLDMALDGPGFFVLAGPNGPLYTRAGRFTRDAAGVLRSPDNLAVLGDTGQPLVIPGGQVRVGVDGTVYSNGQAAGRIGVVALAAESLTRAGTATFTATDPPGPAPATTRVVGGALEGSNVDSTATMATMMMVLRAFEAGRQAIQLQNETLGQSVRDIGTTR
jgi:flagellar basal-body rod protein FlgF